MAREIEKGYSAVRMVTLETEINDMILSITDRYVKKGIAQY